MRGQSVVRKMPSRNQKRKVSEITNESVNEPRATRSRRNTRIEPAPTVVTLVTNENRAVRKNRSKPKAKLSSGKFVKEDARSWFKSLCLYDEDEKSKRIGPSGVQQLAKEIDKDVGDIVFLVLAWKMDAKEMGFFSEEEWMRGMTELQVDCCSKLTAQWEHLRGLLDSKDIFRNVYRFAYDFTKGHEAYCRHLEIAIAQELMKLFLENRWKLCQNFCEFLDITNVKVLNKDQYNNILEFHLLVKDDCSDYDMNSAWPVLMDDFVNFMLARKPKEVLPM